MRMKWNNIKTQTICFEKGLWDKITNKVGYLEDKYDLDISISDVVNELCRNSILNMNELELVSNLKNCK